MRLQAAKQKPGLGRSGWAGRHNGKRLLGALSWLVGTWKTSITAKNAANSRCLVDMKTLSSAGAWAPPRDVYFIFAWGFCKFARSTVMGNSRASTSGTSNKYGSHAFLFLTTNLTKRGTGAALTTICAVIELVIWKQCLFKVVLNDLFFVSFKFFIAGRNHPENKNSTNTVSCLNRLFN